MKIYIDNEMELSGETSRGVYFVIYKDALSPFTPSTELALLEAAAELAVLRARVAKLESIISAARGGEYDNAHEINAVRKFLYEAMEEYYALDVRNQSG